MVDVVEPGAGTHDDSRYFAAREHIGGDLGRAADHEQSVDAVERRDSSAPLRPVFSTTSWPAAADRATASGSSRSLTRTFTPGPRPCARRAAAPLAGWPERVRTLLERGGDRDDVEQVVGAHVTDAQHFALQWSWPPATTIPCTSRRRFTTSAALDAFGRIERGDRVRRALREQRRSPPPAPPRAWRWPGGVALDDALETLLGRSSSALLRARSPDSPPVCRASRPWAELACLLQVEIEPRQPLAFDVARGPRREAHASRVRAATMRPFCDPHTTTSMPHSSCGSGCTPRLVIASTTSRRPRRVSRRRIPRCRKPCRSKSRCRWCKRW